MRKLYPTLNGTDLTNKINTFFEYAAYDKHMVKQRISNMFPQSIADITIV